MLTSLDAHAHLDPARTAGELAGAGAVLAMTLSLAEAGAAMDRHELPLGWGEGDQDRGDLPIAWGVGCHPRKPRSQAAFDGSLFRELAERTAIVGEIGLDNGSQVPMERQLAVFRQVLAVVAEQPRIVSIHSYEANTLVLDELERQPVAAPILHWWTGTAAETRRAVTLGCYFSVHSQVARQSKFRTAIPPERLLVESDHGWADQPAAIPCRIEWVEWLVSQQVRVSREEVRRLAWRNLAAIVAQTRTSSLLPPRLAALLPGA
jgi:TatD DNase family protein